MARRSRTAGSRVLAGVGWRSAPQRRAEGPHPHRRMRRRLVPKPPATIARGSFSGGSGERRFCRRERIARQQRSARADRRNIATPRPAARAPGRDRVQSRCGLQRQARIGRLCPGPARPRGQAWGRRAAGDPARPTGRRGRGCGRRRARRSLTIRSHSAPGIANPCPRRPLGWVRFGPAAGRCNPRFAVQALRACP